MKLNGKKIEGPNVEVIVLPRGENDSIVLRAQAVLDSDPFDKLCPSPKPPTVVRKGGIREQLVEDPRYLQARDEWRERRFAWLVITSLRLGTPELEWEQVDYGNPNTWLRYKDELKESGFSEVEIGRIIQGCMIANALDDNKLDEARNDFFRSLQEPVSDSSSSPADEPNSTPSGEPVNASA